MGRIVEKDPVSRVSVALSKESFLTRFGFAMPVIIPKRSIPWPGTIQRAQVDNLEPATISVELGS
jgi:hypothetical protein